MVARLRPRTTHPHANARDVFFVTVTSTKPRAVWVVHTTRGRYSDMYCLGHDSLLVVTRQRSGRRGNKISGRQHSTVPSILGLVYVWQELVYRNLGHDLCQTGRQQAGHRVQRRPGTVHHHGRRVARVLQPTQTQSGTKDKIPLALGGHAHGQTRRRRRGHVLKQTVDLLTEKPHTPRPQRVAQ